MNSVKRCRETGGMKVRSALALLLALLLVFSVWVWDVPTAQAASGTISTNGTYDIGTYGTGATITITSGLTVSLTNSDNITYKDIQIVCGQGVTLTLNGVKIDVYTGLADVSPLSFTGSDNVLVLQNDCILHGTEDHPGIKVEEGTMLEISGTGTLNVRASGGAAAIGSASNNNAGTITISGGIITAQGGAAGAGIGGCRTGNGGTINITGGSIWATGGYCSPGVGGGSGGSAGTINISGGNVTATGDQDAPGIGGWNGDGVIHISGGTVDATGGTYYGAGIGGGLGSPGGSITISGGTVNARGGVGGSLEQAGGAGIGGGYEGGAGTISISGGNVTATGRIGAAGIGSGFQGIGGTITIDGGSVYAQGGNYDNYDLIQLGGAGIGGGVQSSNVQVVINNGTITASGGYYGAAIGGGSNNEDVDVTINDGNITAIGNDYGAGIGCGYANTGLTISINGGTINARGGGGGSGIGGSDDSDSNAVIISISDGYITAQGGADSAGIGGGPGQSGGQITISGGEVDAISAKYSAGIGGGAGGNGGTIVISGGTVTATSDAEGAAIGGASADGGNINISNGIVNATAGRFGAGIGGGYGASGGMITISGGAVTATGGVDQINEVSGGAGIGGGYQGNGGVISVTHGVITASGGKSSAGIGGSYDGDGGYITVEGGLVFAKGKDGAKDIGAGASGVSSGDIFNISGDAAVFMQNGLCTIPTTSTHTASTFNSIIDNTIYGIPLPDIWSTPVYARLDESLIYNLEYDANEGEGTVSETVTQYKGTVTTVADGSSLTKNERNFVNWNTQQTGMGDSYVPGADYTFEQDIILYAQYESVFAQGDGTEEDPYGISTPEQLDAVRNDLDAYYVLLNDIDMSEATSQGGAFWNSGLGFLPISTRDVPFAGELDGNGYTIDGLYIQRPDDPHIGLFGVLQADAIVRNLTLSNCNLLGDSVGGIAGRNEGTITSCSVSGTVSTAMELAGGITGYNGGSIIDCTNRATISGRWTLGGIAGSNNSLITQCHNMGVVINPNAIELTGGIAGGNNLYGIISYCSNTAQVSGRVYTGGIAGLNYNLITHCSNSGEIIASLRQNGGICGINSGEIEVCFNSGTVKTTGDIEDRTGGIVGQLTDHGQITNCFNTGKIEADNTFGGISGYSTGTITNCYNAAKDGITGNSTGSVVSCYYLDDGNVHTAGTASNAEQLRRQDTFSGYDFSDVWQIAEGQSPPVLQNVAFVNTTGITLSRNVLGMLVGASKTLSATITPADASNKNVVWTSSDESVATVNGGIVTLHTSSTATITAQTLDGGFIDTCSVTVIDIQPVTSVTLSRNSATVADGDTLTLTATVLPSDATYPEVTWSSNNESVATVSQSGVVTAVSSGSTTITATADGVSDTCVVTVVQANIQTSHYTVDRTAGLIKGVADGTTVEALKSHLDNSSDDIKIYDGSDQEITGGAVGTSMIVKLIFDGVVRDELRILVLGDANGDGVISVADYVLVRLDILGLKPLNGTYAAAGDIDRDGRVDVADYTRIRLDILGTQKIN